MKINVLKVGGIWHGTIDGYPDIDARALTEDIARRKVEAIAAALHGSASEKDDEHPLDKHSGR